MAPAHLVEALLRAAATDRGISVLAEGGLQRMTYAELAERASRGAGALEGPPGSPVLLALPNGAPLLAAFFGALWAGRVPAILAPPRPFADGGAWAAGVARLSAFTHHAPVVGTQAVAALLEGSPVHVLAADGLEDGPTRDPHPATPEALALLQLTSGSLGLPKAVRLSHAALVANAWGAGQRLGVTPADATCCWVPLNHDMALAAFLMSTLYGLEQVLLPTERFMRSPARWLELVAEHATMTTAPPFAYELAAQRLARAGRTLDFSRLRVAVVGAEPIDARILQRVQERWAPMGLRPDVFVPCYGLAEATCVVTLGAPERPLRSTWVRAPQVVGQKVQLTPPGEEGALQVVACGEPLQGAQVRLVGEDGAVLPEGEVGHVQVQGPSRMQRYWDDEAATAEALTDDGWVRTGDLGFLGEGGLHIAGRVKDLIILRGRNILPEEIEAVAREVSGVLPRELLAFGEVDPSGGPERVSLVATAAPGADPDALARSLREAVADGLDLLLDAVHLVPRGSIPRTTSGKPRRGEARKRWGGC